MRERMDCGDSSCEFEGRGKGGMRTNGGCRCLKDLDGARMLRARRYIRYLEGLLDEIAEDAMDDGPINRGLNSVQAVLYWKKGE